MKEKIKNIKEMAKNPRKKALLQLGAWFLFFLISYIVIILIPHPTPKYVSSSNQKKESKVEKFEDMNNFEYVYTFSYLGKEEKIEGTYFNKNYYFTYLGQEYYSTLGSAFLVNSIKKTLLFTENAIINLSIKELGIESLSTYWNEGKLVEEKEYNDGKKVSSYEYEKDGKKIFLTVTLKNNFIQGIVVDLTNFVNAELLTESGFQVHLEYKEVNNLSSYSKDYSDYQIIHEEVS